MKKTLFFIALMLLIALIANCAYAEESLMDWYGVSRKEYTCSTCDNTYMRTSESMTTSCCVMHPPGDCCHYGEVQVEEEVEEDQSDAEFLLEFDKKIDEFIYTNTPVLTFGDELLTINVDTGEIYWRSRLVTTDKELVAGLNDIIFEFKCHKCGESLDAKPIE